MTNNELKGVLFRNKKKTSERSPSHTGKVMVDGVEYRVAAWVNDSAATGEKYFSLKLTPPDKNSVPPKTQIPAHVADSDEIPF